MQQELVEMILDTSSGSASTEEQYLKDQFIYVKGKEINLDTLFSMEDSLLAAKLMQIDSSNIPAFITIDSLMALFQFENAMQLNAGIATVNSIESGKQYLNTLIAEKYSVDSLTLNSMDTMSLMNTAYSDPLLLGDPVYISRGMLFLEIPASNPSSGSREASVKEIEQDEVTCDPCLRVTPNPASEKLYIEVVGSFKESSTILIRDIRGMEMFRAESSDIMAWPYELDITGYIAGIYVVTLVNNNTIHATERWVKVQ